MNLPPVLRQRYFSSNGVPLAGGKIYSYQAGTSTPQMTYTDAIGITPNTNPIILDANGEASMWLDPNLSYKFVVQDSGGVTQWTTDGVVGILTNNSVTTAGIQDSAVTTAKIADLAVTRSKLAIGAVAPYAAPSVKITDYTLLPTDDVVLCNAATLAINVTLPAASVSGGKIYFIKKVDATQNNVTILRAGSDVIDGDTSLIISNKYSGVILLCDGVSNWYLF